MYLYICIDIYIYMYDYISINAGLLHIRRTLERV